MQTIRFAALLMLLIPATADAFSLLQPGVKGWPDGVVVYDYDLSKCTIAEDQLLTQINRAITVWNSVPTAHLHLKLGIKLTGVDPAQLMVNVSPGNAIIACSTNFAADTGRNADWTLAVGGAAVDDNGIIGFGYAILNADSTSRLTTGDFTNDELAAVLVHELGHSLGLGHSVDTTAVMYMTAIATPTLAQDDVNAITSLYKNPPGPDDNNNNALFGCATISQVAGRGGRGGDGPSAGSGLGARDFAGLRELALLFALGYMFISGTRKLRSRAGKVALA